MKTIISHLDELFGAGMVSFIRDPTSDSITVSVAKSTLAGAGLELAGWRFVMDSKFCVRTMSEKDWDNYVFAANKTTGA